MNFDKYLYDGTFDSNNNEQIQNERNKLYELFKYDLFEELNLSDHPKKIFCFN